MLLRVCARVQNGDSDRDSDSDSDSELYSDSDSRVQNGDSDGDSDRDSDSDSDSELYSDSDSDSDSELYSDSDSRVQNGDSDRDSDSDSDSELYSDSDSDSELHGVPGQLPRHFREGDEDQVEDDEGGQAPAWALYAQSLGLTSAANKLVPKRGTTWRMTVKLPGQPPVDTPLLRYHHGDSERRWRMPDETRELLWQVHTKILAVRHDVCIVFHFRSHP
eukprot:COSAG03_NODE_3776_length_1832_cov_20.059435_1_plen_219_part_00